MTLSDGRRISTLKKDQLSSKCLRWVHHDGVGYVFLRPQAVTVAAKVQTGRQSDISTESKDTRLVRRKVFSTWIDHGTQPDDATYEYIVLPGKTAAEMQGWKNSFRTIVNNEAVQAVACDTKGLFGIAFYTAGQTIALTPDLQVGVDRPCLLLIELGEDGYSVSLSDPTASLQGEVLVSFYTSRDESAPTNAGSQLNIQLPMGEFTGSTVTKVYHPDK